MTSFRKETIPRDRSYWATIALLVPFYVQRFFIGGQGEEYSDYTGVSLVWLGYVVHFGFLLCGFFIRWRIVDVKKIYMLVLFFIFSIVQIFYVSYALRNYQFTIIPPFARSLLWLLAIFVYCNVFFKRDQFCKAFIEITVVSGIFVLLCYIFYFATGVPFGVDIGRGLPRPQGSFSEPSALAAVFPAFTVLCFYLRLYRQMLLGFLVVAITASINVYVSAGLMGIIFVISQKSFLRKSVVLLYTAIACSFIIFINSSFSELINDSAMSLERLSDYFIGDGAIREYTIDRVVSAAFSLSAFINQSVISDLSATGSSARLAGGILMLRNMEIDGTYLFGYGLGVYGYVANNIYGTILDFGLLPYCISSTGVIGGLTLIYLITLSILRWAEIDARVYIILLGALVGTMYNSAGGIHAYTIAVLALFLPLSIPANRNYLVHHSI